MTFGCGIYYITNTINGKFYVGSSKNIKKRWARHIRDLNNNNHHNIYLQRSCNKYGDTKINAKFDGDTFFLDYDES